MTNTISAGSEYKLIWVSGPVKITVSKGSVRLLGAEYSEGEEIVVHKDRSYIVEILPQSDITVEGLWGKVREPSNHEVEVYKRWLNVVDTLEKQCLSKKHCTITVLGPTDVGKTSFITMLANRLLSYTPVNILDTDLGQSTIGIPGFIALARVREKLLWNRSPQYNELYFIGSITPLGHEHSVTSASVSLARIVGNEPLLVDTDGWFSGLRAIKYKLELVRALASDYVVVIGGGRSELYALAKVLKERIILLEPPPFRVIRGSRERRMLRGDKFLLVENMDKMLVNPHETPFIGTITLGLGEAIEESNINDLEEKLGTRIIHGEMHGEKLVLLTKNRPRTKLDKDIVVITLGDIRGLIMALADGSGRDYAYAFLSGADEARRSLVIQVPSGVPRPRLIRTGLAKFDGESIIMDNRIRLLQRLMEK